jgi:hypothetical protein
MGGLRVKAKGEPVGFHLDTLKEGNVFLQARWLKCFELSCSVGFLAKGFCTCVSFCSSLQGGSCVLADRRSPIVTYFDVK